jgi:hypothetical protein
MATLGLEASLSVIVIPLVIETPRLPDRSFIDLMSIVKLIIDFIDIIAKVGIDAVHQPS